MRNDLDVAKALPQNRLRRLEYCHFEGTCRKETRPLRKVASGASHGEPATPDIAQSVHSAPQAHNCFYRRSPGGLTSDFLMLSLLRRKRGKRFTWIFWPHSPSAMSAGLASLRIARLSPRSK